MSAPSCANCRHGQHHPPDNPVGLDAAWDCTADVVWEPEDVLRLLAWSETRDFVVGPYCTKEEEPADLCGHYDPAPAGHCGQCHAPITRALREVVFWCPEPWALQPSPACSWECAHAAQLDAARWEWLASQRRELDDDIHEAGAELNALLQGGA